MNAESILLLCFTVAHAAPPHCLSLLSPPPPSLSQVCFLGSVSASASLTSRPASELCGNEECRSVVSALALLTLCRWSFSGRNAAFSVLQSPFLEDILCHILLFWKCERDFLRPAATNLVWFAQTSPLASLMQKLVKSFILKKCCLKLITLSNTKLSLIIFYRWLISTEEWNRLSSKGLWMLPDYFLS